MKYLLLRLLILATAVLLALTACTPADTTTYIEPLADITEHDPSDDMPTPSVTETDHPTDPKEPTPQPTETLTFTSIQQIHPDMPPFTVTRTMGQLIAYDLLADPDHEGQAKGG